MNELSSSPKLAASGTADLEGDIRRQFTELEKLQKVLEDASASLNQRATIAATVTPAALAALGAFASRLDANGGPLAAKILVGVASVALLMAAGLALVVVMPRGGWYENFKPWANHVIGGSLTQKTRVDYLGNGVKLQSGRNQEKVRQMRVSYWLLGVATVVTAGAVIATLVA